MHFKTQRGLQKDETSKTFEHDASLLEDVCLPLHKVPKTDCTIQAGRSVSQLIKHRVFLKSDHMFELDKYCVHPCQVANEQNIFAVWGGILRVTFQKERCSLKRLPILVVVLNSPTKNSGGQPDILDKL